MESSPHQRWARFAANPKIGAKTLHKLRATFGDAESVEKATAKKLHAANLDQEIIELVLAQQSVAIEPILSKLAAHDITFIWYDDAEFPTALKELPDAPACLYRKGEPLDSETPAVAVVGSRKATPYGRQVTTDLVAPLAQQGVQIVSGLAFGIDAVAHQATLDAGGRTIAVLANGLDDTFPTSHRALAREIMSKGGSVVSEFPPGTPAQRFNFPIRNRIIAGLSLATLVVEAAEESGSLITARVAIEYGRDVLAVPGPITSPVSAGPHGLIRMGAKLVTSADDILEELSLQRVGEETEVKAISADSPAEAAILAQLTRTPIHLDDLIRESNLDTATVTGALLLMEMKGKARNLGANQYVIGH